MKTAIFLSALLLTSQSVAEVEVQDANGFVIQHELPLDVPKEAAWLALIRPQLWWDPAHSWSGDASNFSLTLEPGGCFCETLPGGGFAEHLRTVYVSPTDEIRLAGGLGPLQGLGFDGVMTWKLTDSESGGLLRWTYRVDGRVSQNLETLPTAVDGVLRGQLQRLSDYLGQIGSDESDDSLDSNDS